MQDNFLDQFFKKPEYAKPKTSADAVKQAQQAPDAGLRKLGTSLKAVQKGNQKESLANKSHITSTQNRAIAMVPGLTPEQQSVLGSALYMNAKGPQGFSVQPNTPVSDLQKFSIDPQTASLITLEFKKNPQKAAEKYAAQRDAWRKTRQQPVAPKTDFMQTGQVPAQLDPEQAQAENLTPFNDPFKQSAVDSRPENVRLDEAVQELTKHGEDIGGGIAKALGGNPLSIVNPLTPFPQVNEAIGKFIGGTGAAIVATPASYLSAIDYAADESHPPLDRTMSFFNAMFQAEAAVGGPVSGQLFHRAIKGGYNGVRALLTHISPQEAEGIAKAAGIAVQDVEKGIQSVKQAIEDPKFDKEAFTKNLIAQEKPLEVGQGVVEKPAEPPVAQEVQKEPWQMTREEFGKAHVYHGAGDRGPHKNPVQDIRDSGFIKHGYTVSADTSDAAKVASRFAQDNGAVFIGRKVADYSPENANPDYPGVFGAAGEKVVGEVPPGVDPHKFLVQQAFAEGKPVPDSVLQDYPDLRAKAVNGDASVSQGGLDRLASYPANVRNALESPAFREHGLSGLDVPTQRLVMARVIPALHDPEVFNAVVKSVPVDVVNQLARLKPSANVGLHDGNMLPDLLSGNLEDSVTLRADVADAMVRAVTRATAKEGGGSLDLVGVPSKGSAASGANNLSHEPSIPSNAKTGTPEVLKDYPDLAPKAQEKPNAIQEQTASQSVLRQEEPQLGLQDMVTRDQGHEVPPQGPQAEAQKEGLGPVELNSGVNFQQMADMFNTGKSGKKLYASPWDKLRNLVGSGLHTLDRVAPQVSMAVRKMGNSGGEANLLSKGLVNHIDTKIGTPGFFFKEVVPLIVDSRLQGIAERYVANGDLPSSLKVKRLMSDAEFAAKSADPKVQQALKIYRDTIEKGLSESHASNEGVFSDALGPLDTYYPLTRLDEAGKPVGTAYGKSSPLLRKPGNPRNKQATGFGLDYDVTPQGFQRAVKGMVYTNNRGAMVKALEDSGIAQIVDAKDAANIHSVVVNGIEWDAKPVATGVRGKVAMVPSGMAKELSHALENGLEASSAHGFVNTLNHIALQGLAEPVIHSLNLLGTIWSEPLAGGLNPATRVLGNTPFVSRFSKLGELLTTKTLDESAVRDLQDMARIGLLPGKTQGVTTAYTKAGRQAAKNIGVEAKYDLSPSLYGQNGIDTKARLYMYRLAKATGANTDADIAKIVNRLPEYNKAAEGILERGSKRAGTGPFYTAGQTMIRNGIDAWRLSHRLPEGMSKIDKAKVLTAHHIGNGVLGFTGVWVAANMIVTGKPPWENGSRYGEINLGNGKAVNVGLFYPVEMRGARVLGIKGAHDTKSAYPDAANFQMMEAGMKDSINGLLHPLTGPVAKMGSIALTGMEPSVSGFRDYITGKSSLNLYRGAPDTGSSQTKTNLLYGLANVNSFGLQFLEKIGLVKPVFEGKAAEDSGPFAAMVELSGLRPVVEYDQQKKKLNLMKQKFKVMRADIKREALGK